MRDKNTEMRRESPFFYISPQIPKDRDNSTSPRPANYLYPMYIVALVLLFLNTENTLAQRNLPAKPTIYGNLLDKSGRCIHYHSRVDIIANMCRKCKRYYACYKCHNQLENHHLEPHTVKENSTEKIVLCGNCLHEMSYNDYKNSKSCPSCKHPFNPNCAKHAHLYFKTDAF